MVLDGRRSPGTVETYRRQLKNHILPALGEVRLGEATTPLVDKVIGGAIRADVSPATAKSCRSVISGVMGLAVRYGAVTAKPVREVDRIEAQPKKEPRGLSTTERRALLEQLQADPRARRHDLPDLGFHARDRGTDRGGVGDALVGSRLVGRDGADQQHAGPGEGGGLLRKGTKSRAGERTLPLPVSEVAVLRRRYMTGARLHQPQFPDVLGGFRDPANAAVLSGRHGDRDLAWITSHNFRKTAATILDDAALSARLVADQLGHSRPSMTQDVYMGHRTVTPKRPVRWKRQSGTRCVTVQREPNEHGLLRDEITGTRSHQQRGGRRVNPRAGHEGSGRLTCKFVRQGQSLCLIGDSGTGKSHLLIGLGTAAAQAGHRVRYVLAAKLVNELVEAADERQLSRTIARYGRVELLCLLLCVDGVSRVGIVLRRG
jgi:hypothetical protein